MPVEYLGDNSYRYENFYDIQRIQLWDKEKWNNFGSSTPAEGTVTTIDFLYNNCQKYSISIYV